jgi:hypothetical protein
MQTTVSPARVGAPAQADAQKGNKRRTLGRALLAAHHPMCVPHASPGGGIRVVVARRHAHVRSRQTCPGDAAALLVPPTATPEDAARLRVELALDAPIAVQYAGMGGLLRGDLGESFTQRRPVVVLREALPVSLWLGVSSLVYVRRGRRDWHPAGDVEEHRSIPS